MTYRLLPKTNSSMEEEWLDIGLQHQVAGRYPEAEQAYLRGLRVNPNCCSIITNMGVMAAQVGDKLRAVQHLERALIFDDKNATTWYDYAFALLDAERAPEALAAIDKSIELAESADALAAKGMILTSCADAAGAVEAYDKALAKDPAQPMAAYNTLFARTLKNTTPEDNYAARRRWYEHHRWKGEKQPHANAKDPHRPLRVGYVGGDFKMHSAHFLFGSVILRHDKSAVEPYCYMSMTHDPAADASTKKFVDATTWRDISAKGDDEAEALIRADGIDILVDLSGHTGGNRLTLLTRKPAPIQCHAWGFAHGTGIPEVDYFLADPYAVPQGERQHFAEQVWDLPAIVGYTPPEEYKQSGTSVAPVGRDGVFTFGVFGRYEKFSPQSVEAWHKILLSVPESRLVIKDLAMMRPYAIRHLRGVMHDVDPSRVLFMQNCSHTDQMLSYQGVDLVLDTFPHTGGVTALEIIYMGVPIVTLYNGQVGGRTTAVALKAIGRTSWVASSVSDYVRKAVKLAESRAELASARKALRGELLKSPLCGEGYARAVEQAYREMWWRYCGHADAADTGDAGLAEQHASASTSCVDKPGDQAVPRRAGLPDDARRVA